MNNYLINTFMRERFLRILSVGLALFLFSGNIFAGNMSLAWDASTSSNVGGYKVSYGATSKNYTSSIDVGNKTSYQVTGLQEGAKYYFAVKAYDSAKTTESSYSNEISATVPAASTLTADFTASKTSGNAPLVVNFTPSTTGTVTGYQWNFGDSSIASSTSQNATVTYTKPGTYTVSLTVTGSSGTVTKTKSNLITVTTPAPVANFTATPTSGTAPVLVSFTDTSTGSITSRSWNFGDGSTSTAINPTHTYSVSGTYTVSLTVTGTGGSNTKTSSNLINVSTTSQPPADPPASGSEGLVAAYGFEETSGTTVADASGNGNHGTMTNAVGVSTGKYGRALSFNGSNAWVTVQDSDSLDLSAGMTLEAWVYPTATMSGWKTVIMKEQSPQQAYALMANSDSNQAAMIPTISGSEKILTGGTQLTANQWWHIAATYDGQNEHLYVNGSLVATKAQTGAILTSTGALCIGGNSIWGEYFKGYIDEVRIYNRALTETEVNTNLATAISGSGDPSTPSTPSTSLQFIMGNTNEEPWVDYRKKGVAQAFQAVPVKSGSITELEVYLDSSSTTATKLVAGIYKDSNGHPGTLVAQGTLSALIPGAWNTVSIPSTSVTAGQFYWIAILGPDGQIGFLDQVGSGTSLMERTSYRSSLSALPAKWTSSSYGYQTNASMSIYGNGY